MFINGVSTYKFATADFEDYNSLKKVGDNLYEGQNPNYGGEVSVQQGVLEKSNVNIINEMVNMMTVMRSFETNQKVVQTLDETLGKAASEIGAVR
ncbi:Flagellar basal-body rod protein FlgG [compost metagenome]